MAGAWASNRGTVWQNSSSPPSPCIIFFLCTFVAILFVCLRRKFQLSASISQKTAFHQLINTEISLLKIKISEYLLTKMNRNQVLPALANLMNPVEPDQRYPQQHQQENRALPFTSQPHSHSSFPNNNGSSNNNANYIPSISSFSSASGENPTVITSRQPPALAGPPISWQLAPLSALTSTLPPPNGRFAPYSHYQTSRSDPKIYGSSRNFPSGSYSSLDQSFPRDSFSGGHGQEGHNNHTLPPLRNSNGWKDPIPLPSSSSIASSSTKSNSTSPQPTNWDDQATPRGSSDCVHGRSYVPKMDAFPTDEVGLSSKM